jgi:hypothetical protein
MRALSVGFFNQWVFQACSKSFRFSLSENECSLLFGGSFSFVGGDFSPTALSYPQLIFADFSRQRRAGNAKLLRDLFLGA